MWQAQANESHGSGPCASACFAAFGSSCGNARAHPAEQPQESFAAAAACGRDARGGWHPATFGGMGERISQLWLPVSANSSLRMSRTTAELVGGNDSNHFAGGTCAEGSTRLTTSSASMRRSQAA